MLLTLVRGSVELLLTLVRTCGCVADIGSDLWYCGHWCADLWYC